MEAVEPRFRPGQHDQPEQRYEQPRLGARQATEQGQPVAIENHGGEDAAAQIIGEGGAPDGGKASRQPPAFARQQDDQCGIAERHRHLERRPDHEEGEEDQRHVEMRLNHPQAKRERRAAAQAKAPQRDPPVSPPVPRAGQEPRSIRRHPDQHQAKRREAERDHAGERLGPALFDHMFDPLGQRPACELRFLGALRRDVDKEADAIVPPFDVFGGRRRGVRGDIGPVHSRRAIAKHQCGHREQARRPDQHGLRLLPAEQECDDPGQGVKHQYVAVPDDVEMDQPEQ